MQNSLYQPRRRRIEMNLLPLIDVLVMLVFFSFVTMQFKSAQSLNLTLPKIETAGKSDASTPIIIAVKKDGMVFVNTQQYSDEQFEAQIRELAKQGTDTTVLIKADEDAPVKRLTFVMDTCRKHALNKIKLQSR
jgi:biopolymer transport protein ExbD